MELDLSYTLVMVRIRLMELLVNVLRLYESQAKSSASDQEGIHPIIKQVLTVIHSGDFNEQSVTDLAKQVNVSRSHLDRLFKSAMGVNMGEYRTLIRLDKAKHELRQNEGTITSIADKLQFGSTQAFCNFFNRHTGYYPQQYRKIISLKSTEANE
ncbi:Helix-turn-helix domain-containing protein [Paenibacillus sp. yr247]|nr:Helix-turn-helix domain-containing protein [Paenibacillus sp. yr247]